jgi:phage tail sheath protein FI
MPQYLSPGVYVEEQRGTPPIIGVGTSTAAFIGVVNTATANPDGKAFAMPFKPGRPLDPNNIVAADRYDLAAVTTPTLITNWEQFKNNFGDIQAGNKILAHAVYGFFNNGGTRCWVTRVNDLTNATQVGDALKAGSHRRMAPSPRRGRDAGVQAKVIGIART